MLSLADIFSSNIVVLSTDQKEFEKKKKKVSFVVPVIEVRKLIHLEIKGLFQRHRAGSKAT